MVFGRAAPLGVEIDAVVIRVPSHVVPVRKAQGVPPPVAASPLMRKMPVDRGKGRTTRDKHILERALRARADTWEKVRRAEEDGTMSRREAEEERQKAARLVQQAWSGGYKRACEVGGAIFVAMALTPYGGWHGEKNSAESWTRRTTHTGDEVGYYEFDQRFEHPGRTWASATHRAFTFACVGAAMANETWKFVQAKSKQAMKQVLGIRDEKTRMKVTLPLALAPVTQEDDMRWNPNDDGIVSNP